MAVQIISRPIGHKLSSTQVEGTVYDNGAGDAVVYVPGGHSLSDGDYVYIESNIEAYAGFKYVDSTSYDYFKIKNSEDGDYITYYQDSAVTMYVSTLEHGWQSVHLPIVYELNSDLWPINVAEEEYNPNTVDSFESFAGSVQLNLDHALSDPTALSYIELVGDGPLAGPYQITNVLQDWSVVINLAYDSTYDFSGYVIVKYYNNYHINVEVWSGLEPDHRWVDLKPFELAATLKFIPDSVGDVKFSIHEVLRGYVQTRNNLTLETLPNNIDFHTAFYIKVYESYDVSDGVEITVQDGDETDDSASFIGHAVNSMMPFKSLNSGFMSDYVAGGGELARWLTLFDVPTAIIGYFFDLSFINISNGFDINVIIQKSTGGITTETDVLEITNPGSGVIRVPFTPTEGFDMYCLQAFLFGELTISALSQASNYGDGDETWSLSGVPVVTGLTTGEITKILRIPINGALINQQIDFVVDLDFLNTGGGGGTFNTTPLFYLFNSLMTESVQIGGGDLGGVYISAGNKVESHTLTATGFVPAYFAMTFEYTGAGGYIMSVDINSVTIQSQVTNTEITEQICVNVVEECGTTFTDDDLRLLEDGPFRELE